MCHSLWEDDNLDTANEAEDEHSASHVASKAGVHFLGILQGGREREKKLPNGGDRHCREARTACTVRKSDSSSKGKVPFVLGDSKHVVNYDSCKEY